ncbi:MULTISPECIES: methyltransferase [unclassified Bradyrhizobium]|uniref:methyltransferase n=1 Tax=unclassified Bradyrhizobium TaxID=2631580 RepID=UPI0028E5BBD0|nr:MULTISPECIES: methyltransferase [unclassified Bradyrhizobium]
MDLGFIALSRFAFGYWEAQTLFSLVEFGVPERLGTRALTTAELSGELDLPEQTIERLLNASVALKLLDHSEGRYSNSPMSQRFLVPGTSETLLNWVRVMGRWAPPWTKLSDAIRTGSPVESQDARLGADPDYMRDFILGMHEFARRSSALLAPFVDRHARALIDVGGGAGTYSIALCKDLPELRATVLDLAPVLAVTRQTAASEGVADRLGTAIADYRTDPFGSNADIVLMSNVLHQETTEICRSMLHRAHDALRPGGQVLVQGYFLSADRVSPTFVTLHNLSALALWAGGSSRTVAEMVEMLREAGFSGIDAAALGSSGLSLIRGRRE